MAESTDKTTRRIAEKRVEKGKEFEGYQEAQNQLLSIQAEQQQNLALQSQGAANIQAQNQMLGQAAEIMNMDNLNPTTQGMLSRYGLSQPRVIRNTQTQRQGPNNITINNTTINNASGPVQGREISIKPQEASQGRFKAWLTNVFARQDAQWQKQNQEYAKRESGLTRNANKMMRKIESLGKEIGNAVDPRKASQRAQNSTMNLLKALGFVYFAKKLPDIFKFINKAEVWVKDLGEKIGGFFGDNTDKLDLDDTNTIWGKIKYTFWNKKETGIFNVLLEKVSRAIYDRKQLADAVIGEVDWKVLQPGESMKHFLDWFTTFIGGTKAARQVLNKKREGKIRDEMHLSENYSGTDNKFFFDNGREIKLTDNNDSAILVRQGANGGTDVNQEFNDWFKKKKYAWYKKGLAKTKEEFLKERGKDLLAYFGEADILTARLHKLNREVNVQKKHQARTTSDDLWEGNTTLTTLDLNFTGDRLNSSSYRGTLAASLDIYKLLKGSYNIKGAGVTSSSRTKGNDVNIERILYLLKLLSKSDDILVFEKFTTLFKIPKEDLTYVNIKLVIHSFAGSREREFYQNGYDFSTYYRKILYETDKGDKVKLSEEPDFNNQLKQDHWKVVKIGVNVIQDIIYKLLGTDTVDDYSTETQQLVANNLKEQGIITEDQLRNTQETISWNQSTNKNIKSYDKSISSIKEVEREAELFDRAQEARRTEKYSVENVSSYVKSRDSKIAMNKPRVCYTERSSDFNATATDSDKKKAPRLSGKYISGVTKAFGGSGMLTSNFMEWRGHRYHYGVDLANGAGQEVLFPGYGTIINTKKDKNNGTCIDIKDSDGYVTRYWHTKLYGGLQVGSQVSPGQPIGITERKGENGNSHNPHIHVEVHDPQWSKSGDRHRHYLNPLVYWSTHKASVIDDYQSDYDVQSNVPEISESNNGGAVIGNGQYLPTTSTKSTTPTYYVSPNAANSETMKFASNMTPANSTKVQEENSNNNLLAQCANGINYIATSIAPLNDNINTGNMRVAEAIMKSKAPQNLTPQEQPLNTNNP